MLNHNTKLFRVQDLAAIFEVKPATVRHWLKKYEMPVIKIGKRIYLRPETVNAFLDERTAGKSEATKA